MDLNDASAALRRTPGVSLHRQLYVALRNGIRSGAWAAGAALPSEEALRNQFEVSRVTVRRALADLDADGLVERRHGRGTFVALHAPARATPPSAVDGLRKTHAETKVRVLGVSRVAPPPAIARLLQLEPGDIAVHALRLRSIGSTPVMLTDAWVPAKFGRNVTAASLKTRALYELLLAQEVIFGSVEQRISAEAAPPQHAGLLKTEVGAPLIRMVRLLHGINGEPLHHVTAYLSPERSHILMQIAPASMNTVAGGRFVHDGLSARARSRRSDL